MENDPHPTFGNGKICYLEIPAVNIDRSAAFYEKVFGWHIRRRNDGSTSFDDAVGEVRGTWVTGRNPHSGKGLTIHIMVYDIQATMMLVTENGGVITRPGDMDLSEITASFSDPAGNIFGMYQPNRV